MPDLKVIIIEDEFFAANQLMRVVKEVGHEPVKVFHSGGAFLKEENLVYDAAIVDIQLSDNISGLDVARTLNENGKPFVFLTANNEHKILLEAAKLKPAAYISKPFKINDISVALEIIALNQIPPIKIKTSNGYEFIDPSEILFVKSDNTYVEIIMEERTIVQRKLLKEFRSELPDYFIRVHRSYIINKQRIKSENASYIFIGEHKIPKSRNFKSQL